MIRYSIKAIAVFAFTAAVSPIANAQHYNGCDPSCAAPCDPTCAVPSGCSTCGNGNGCNTCYQPQQIQCEPQGLFRHRPLFNMTRIHIQNTEKCCQPQAQSCQTAQPMAMPMMTMQPVQLQMTAYQPMAMQPIVQQAVVAQPMTQQFVQPMAMAPVAQQFVQPMAMAQQFVQPVAVQQVAMQQLAAVRPLQQQSAGDDCNLQQVCKDLQDLKERVNALAKKVEDGNMSTSLNERLEKHEQAIEKLNEASNLQTEILQGLKKQLDAK